MTDAERFVERFARIWQKPEPDAYADLWHGEGTLLHPGMEAPIPAPEIPDYVRRILRAAPDIRLDVESWAASQDIVLIEWTITTTIAGEERRWGGADRFTLRGDRAVEGVAYFDTLPLWAAVDPSLQRGELLDYAPQETGSTS